MGGRLRTGDRIRIAREPLSMALKPYRGSYGILTVPWATEPVDTGVQDAKKRYEPHWIITLEEGDVRLKAPHCDIEVVEPGT
jgi:hypothetical protein